MNGVTSTFISKKLSYIVAVGAFALFGALFSACSDDSDSASTASTDTTAKTALEQVDTSKTLVVYSGRKEKLIAPILEQFTADTGVPHWQSTSPTGHAKKQDQSGLQTPTCDSRP